ncbi:MAG: hypothetical protein FJ403_12930 [Verrucomicrobia bacterium]|nr:hypothetical protein [Verrucomicrobiota bacterium]
MRPTGESTGTRSLKAWCLFRLKQLTIPGESPFQWERQLHPLEQFLSLELAKLNVRWRVREGTSYTPGLSPIDPALFETTYQKANGR